MNFVALGHVLNFGVLWWYLEFWSALKSLAIVAGIFCDVFWLVKESKDIILKENEMRTILIKIETRHAIKMSKENSNKNNFASSLYLMYSLFFVIQNKSLK